MKYISLFSGVGGLESGELHPALVCEIDPACAPVLKRRFAGVNVHPDVTTLEPSAAEVVTGGWPCQDISVAGLRRGLAGERSGLFFELLRVAEQARAHTIVAENVPNLLSLDQGRAFDLVLRALDESGFRHVAWRTINAREFGLPHERRRIFIVASRHREIALALHREIPERKPDQLDGDRGFAGFYWTAGLQSICYSKGFAPTLKVGSSLSIPSPPALQFDGVVRKATPTEVLRLQGFDPAEFVDVAEKDIYRMAGNAVAAPVGRWVFDSVKAEPIAGLELSGFGFTGAHGLYEHGVKKIIEHPVAPLATNLSDVIDREDRSSLSPRAAAGLVRRLLQSGKPCPDDLYYQLVDLAENELEPSYRSKCDRVPARVAETGPEYSTTRLPVEDISNEEGISDSKGLLELSLFG